MWPPRRIGISRNECIWGRCTMTRTVAPVVARTTTRLTRSTGRVLARHDQAAFVSQHDQLRAVAGVKLGHNAADVGLRRQRRYVEAGGDLVVRQPRRDQ